MSQTTGLSPAAALPRQGIQFLRYVVHAEINAFAAKGWRLADDLQGTPHGHYAVLMVWSGEGEPE